MILSSIGTPDYLNQAKRLTLKLDSTSRGALKELDKQVEWNSLNLKALLSPEVARK